MADNTEDTYQAEKARLDKERERLQARYAEEQAREEQAREAAEAAEKTAHTPKEAEPQSASPQYTCSFTQEDYMRAQLEREQAKLKQQKKLLRAIKRKKRLKVLVILLLLAYPIYWCTKKVVQLVETYHPEVEVMELIDSKLQPSED